MSRRRVTRGTDEVVAPRPIYRDQDESKLTASPRSSVPDEDSVPKAQALWNVSNTIFSMLEMELRRSVSC